MIYQFNVAQMKYPKDAPGMQSFFTAVPHVQRLAESAPGFIWRELNEDDPTIGKRLGTDFIVNLSAWESLDALYAFVFSQSHRQIMMARDHWFTHVGKALSVVWFANDAPYPTWDQAIDRLEMLWQIGPTEDAFDYSWAYANALITKSLEL
jgi:heme-degrading monooxygenase HmoA